MENKQMNVQNFVKEENPSNVRLVSLRWPRDLTLGGNKPKKVYTPNLNVTRNKSVAKNVTKNGDRKPIKPNLFPRKRDMQNQRYVQSAGVFSEGTAEVARPARQVDRSISYRDRESVATMVLPKVNRNSWNVNKNTEDVVMADLKADMDCDSDEDDVYEPIVLNNTHKKDRFSVSDKSVKLKGVNIPNGEEKLKHIKQEPDIKQEYIPAMLNDDTGLLNFLDPVKITEEHANMFIVKTPSSFAGRGGTDNPEDKNVDFKLKNMLEGQIGKVLVRKSGKVEVQIGRITYEMEPARSSSFCEEIMLVSSNKIAKLGDVKGQYIVSPMWDTLYKNVHLH